MGKIAAIVALCLLPVVYPSTKASAAWIDGSWTSPLDDKKAYYAENSSFDFKNNDGATGNSDITIQCQNNRMIVHLQFDNLYVSDAGYFGTVTFRIDKQNAFDLQMTASNDNHSLAALDADGLQLAKKLIGGKQLLVRVTPVNENPVYIYYGLDNLGEHIAKVRQECGW